MDCPKLNSETISDNGSLVVNDLNFEASINIKARVVDELRNLKAGNILFNDVSGPELESLDVNALMTVDIFQLFECN